MISHTNLLMDRLPKYFASAIVLIVILYAVLTPNPPSIQMFSFPHMDKVIHFLMFGGLAATILWDYGRLTGKYGVRQWLIVGLCCGAFGFLTELFQEIENAGRSADWKDGLADFSGAFIVPLIFSSIIRGHTRHRRMRLSDLKKTPGDKDRKLYEGSFPEDERREWSALEEISNDRKDSFRLTHVMYQGRFAGIIYWWDFGDFAYIEHFAIDSSARNCGLGGRALDMFTTKLRDKGVVLEVEPETDGELARRRIGFYQRHGFELIKDFKYLQPPYSSGKNELELCLMTKGKCPQAEIMALTLRKEVYGAN